MAAVTLLCPGQQRIELYEEFHYVAGHVDMN